MEVWTDDEGRGVWKEGDVSCVIPMVMAPDHGVDGLQRYSLLPENLTCVPFYSKARYHIAETLGDCGRMVPIVLPTS